MGLSKPSRRSRKQQAQEAKARESRSPGPSPAVPDDDGGRAVEQPLFAEARVQHFTGPLPPPHVIADYEAVVPGMAEKIVTAFEEQGRHRRTLEDLSIREQWRLARRGQVFAFTLGLVALGFAGTAILFGREVSSLA